ncbi:GYG1 [Cordylochernes scorpioides]|uniref:glycogenin glucosyltransferase n=1 Tax=Cordylochernes scorpioides TaxID=51811 RepID=A0ABY6KSH0_9ARAC|nr:GYG1 [Cordylochernes scorpioides]
MTSELNRGDVVTEAWVTLATNDTYGMGALVLGHSLRRVATSRKLAILITSSISQPMRNELGQVYDDVVEVNVLDSKDEANLALMERPELGITFTKLHCWRLSHYTKCVFLDADCLVVKNCDELFAREELSAAPDVGWPDCFNSGVFVFQPSQATYTALLKLAVEQGSFDGDPELEPYHYIRAVDRIIGGTNNVYQVSKINGHYLMGLNNRGLAERLISEGLEVEGTLFRAFPFRKRAMKITVGNLPFFVEDSTIISALTPYGRVTSIAPKLMKAGPYIYNDGRRDAFIVLHEGVTTERLPTRLEIKIKGEVWPAYLSYGIRCSRCHGQGHRRANCPLLAGRANSRLAPPTSPAGVPSTTTSAPPQRSAAQPPAPAPSSTAMEIPGASHAARAVTPSAAPRPSTPVASAVPMEMAPPAPPPVTPAPSLRAPGSHEPAAPTPDIEMSIVEETSTSSTSSSKTSTREGLVTFIERNPGVSFAQTDALGLGREEVLDILSSKTKARKRGPLLSPPQGDALAGLIRQLLGQRPGGSSNIYKVLGQVRAALKTSPAAVPPTPPLPAPRPAEPTPPAPQRRESAPAMAAPPPPPSAHAKDDPVPDRWKVLKVRIKESMRGPFSNFVHDTSFCASENVEAVQCPEKRESFLAYPSPRQKIFLAQFLDAVCPGGDQGLLNMYFSSWATRDISRHLPFIYNMNSNVSYTYLPAYKQFGKDVKIVHFLGAVKPWHHAVSRVSGRVEPHPGSPHVWEHLQAWWELFLTHVQPKLDPSCVRISPSFPMSTNLC